VAGEFPQPTASQTPAIVLYGGALLGMDDNRRQEIAQHLAGLLGVQADVRHFDTETATQTVVAQKEPPEPIPPFSLVFNGSWGGKGESNPYIDAANARSPGVIEDNDLLSKALRAVFMCPFRAERQRVNTELLTYHFSASGQSRGHLRGVTFKNPQMLLADPERARKHIPWLGSKGAAALAQFVTAVTEMPEHS
jgi:hypothetical protein